MTGKARGHHRQQRLHIAYTTGGTSLADLSPNKGGIENKADGYNIEYDRLSFGHKQTLARGWCATKS